VGKHELNELPERCVLKGCYIGVWSCSNCTNAVCLQRIANFESGQLIKTLPAVGIEFYRRYEVYNK
jgi:hypothetical protein